MAWTTTKSLANIRRVFKRVAWEFTERKTKDAQFFRIVVDDQEELESVLAVYEPGRLALYLVFGVKPAWARRKELLEFANLMNDTAYRGCVIIREVHKRAGGLTVLYRCSVDHHMVKDLEEGYVASLIDEAVDMVRTIDLPLILIAKGASARQAIKRTLNRRSLPIR